MLDERPLFSRSCIVDIGFMTSRFPSFTTMADPLPSPPLPPHSRREQWKHADFSRSAVNLQTSACRGGGCLSVSLQARGRLRSASRLSSVHQSQQISAASSHHAKRQRLGHVFAALLTAACLQWAGPGPGLRPLPLYLKAKEASI